jgi:hypothetical protein
VTANIRQGGGKVKLKFKYIYRRGVEVYNRRGDWLGSIRYQGEWEEYVWSQQTDIIMSADCLKQIVNKLTEMNEKRKAGK